MTTYFREDVTCAVCHKASAHNVLGSTNTFGSPDLDLRPAEMQRSTMHAWLQRCPHCNYIASDLAELAGDTALVSGAAYRDVLNDPGFSELARWFLAHALLFESSDPCVAARARLRAAWVCDDSLQPERAVACRDLAAACFTNCKPFEDSEPGVTQGAVFVDVLRRAGQFERAVSECDALLACGNAKGVLRQVLEYQRRLAERRDTAVHSVDEVVNKHEK